MQRPFPHWKSRAWIPIGLLLFAVAHQSVADVVLWSRDQQTGGIAEGTFYTVYFYLLCWWFQMDSYLLKRRPSLASGMYFSGLLPVSILGHLWRTRGPKRSIAVTALLVGAYYLTSTIAHFLAMAFTGN